MATSFSSPTGEFFGSLGESLAELLATRKAEERQRILDALAKEQAESVMAERKAESKRQETQLAETTRMNRVLQAQNIAATAGGDERATPESAALLKEAGLGQRLEQRFAPGTPGIGVLAESELPPDAQVGETVETIKPGFAYEQAREAGKERVAAAKLAAQARAETEQERTEDRALARGQTAELARERMQTSRDIAGASLGFREDLAAQKADVEAQAKNKEAKERRAVALGHADTMRAAMANLVDTKPNGDMVLKPGTALIVGKSRIWPSSQGVIPGFVKESFLGSGSQGANAKAALKQLVSLNVVELINEMKKQSRTGATGFGQLAIQELELIKSAATRLDQAQSDDEFLEAAKELSGKIDKIYEEPTSSSDDKPLATPASRKKYEY